MKLRLKFVQELLTADVPLLQSAKLVQKLKICVEEGAAYYYSTGQINTPYRRNGK